MLRAVARLPPRLPPRPKLPLASSRCEGGKRCCLRRARDAETDEEHGCFSEVDKPCIPAIPSSRSIMSGNTSPVCPKFIPLGDSGNIAESNSSALKFRIVSYNILAQVYVRSSLFPHSPSACLKWKARSQAILTVLKSMESDFLCIQELDEFSSFYKANMENVGYLSVYIQRTGQKRDGCGIFYKHGSAELILKEEIEYNDLVRNLDTESVTDGNAPGESDSNIAKASEGIENASLDDRGNLSDPRIRLKRDCVGILAAFKLQIAPQHVVIVANTHIYWDPELADVKFAQVEYLLLRLGQFKESVSKKFNCAPSVIVTGDFNSQPGDEVYERILSGNTPTEPAKQIRLSSLYASIGGEPPFTNCTPGFTGTLDYIFYSNTGDLKPVSYLEIPGPDSEDVKGCLPNCHHPSDHLPIGGDFEVICG